MAQLDFGLFYEIPVAAPWHARSERDAYHRVIDQAVLGEQVGFSHFWTVEHHFLSEFSHCSAPEVLYGAVAARARTRWPPCSTACATGGSSSARDARRRGMSSRGSASTRTTRGACGKRRST